MYLRLVSHLLEMVTLLLIVIHNVHSYIANMSYQLDFVWAYVTGYWKTDHNVTLDQLHFIGPANSHTHALSVHWCIIGLGWLVCFSRAGFVDRVKLWLRQWDPWRALDGRNGSDIHPCCCETPLKALQSCLGLWPAFLGLIATPNSPIGRYNLPLPSHPPPPPTPPTPLYMQFVILQWSWKKLLKIQ